MSGLRQNTQRELARELSERGETPLAGVLGVEPVVAVEEPESPATTRTLCACCSSTCRTAAVRDPYARWCGRGGAVRCPPIPIHGWKQKFIVWQLIGE
jgi:hypothetical protein